MANTVLKNFEDLLDFPTLFDAEARKIERKTQKLNRLDEILHHLVMELRAKMIANPSKRVLETMLKHDLQVVQLVHQFMVVVGSETQWKEFFQEGVFEFRVHAYWDTELKTWRQKKPWKKTLQYQRIKTGPRESELQGRLVTDPIPTRTFEEFQKEEIRINDETRWDTGNRYERETWRSEPQG